MTEEDFASMLANEDQELLSQPTIRVGQKISGVIATISADYTATGDDQTLLIDASGGAVTITLPDATSLPGITYDIYADDITNSATIATTSSQTIGVDGDTTIEFLSEGDNYTLQSTGTKWIIK